MEAVFGASIPHGCGFSGSQRRDPFDAHTVPDPGVWI